MEPVEVQSVDLGAGSEGTQEVVGAAAAAGEATLQKSESVEEGQEEEDPEASK